MYIRFNDKSQRVIVEAQNIAKERRLPKVELACILAALARTADSFAQIFLADAGILTDEIESLLPAATHSDEEIPLQVGFDRLCKRHLEIAYEQARQLGHGSIGTEHLLLGLLAMENHPASAFLRDKGITREQVLAKLKFSKEAAADNKVEQQRRKSTGHEERRRAWEQHAEPAAATESETKRDSVISVRLDDATLANLDALIQADVFKSRSEAAHFLIKKGIAAQADAIEQVTKRLSAIKEIQDELKQLFNE